MRKTATAKNKVGGGIAPSFQFWCSCVTVAEQQQQQQQ
jgi:hypothetical protein